MTDLKYTALNYSLYEKNRSLKGKLTQIIERTWFLRKTIIILLENSSKIQIFISNCKIKLLFAIR